MAVAFFCLTARTTAGMTALKPRLCLRCASDGQRKSASRSSLRSSIEALPDSTRAEASDGRGLRGWMVERHGAMSAPHDFVIYEAIIAPRDRGFWLMAAFSGWGLLKWCWPLRCPSGFPRCDVGVIGFWSAHTFYPHPAICPLWAFPAATREEPDPTRHTFVAHASVARS
jgi:hypothetical protein